MKKETKKDTGPFSDANAKKIRKILGISESQSLIVLAEQSGVTKKGETKKGGIIVGRPVVLMNMLAKAGEMIFAGTTGVALDGILDGIMSEILSKKRAKKSKVKKSKKK